MINMSYCRQENTYLAIREAFGDVEDHLNEEARYPVSEREIYQFRKIVNFVHDFMIENELVDEYGDLDEERLDEICEAMRKGNEEE